MRPLATITFVLLSLLLPLKNASASKIFTVSGISLAGGAGGMLSGTFTTNDAITLVTSFDITAPLATVGGFTFPGFEYTTLNSTVTAQNLASFFRLDSTSGGNELQLVFTGGLTATGGTVAGNSYEHEPAGGNRAATGPVTLAPSAAPEPSTIALFGFGLVGALAFARKKRVR
jgi:hypothetical protein